MHIELDEELRSVFDLNYQLEEKLDLIINGHSKDEFHDIGQAAVCLLSMLIDIIRLLSAFKHNRPLGAEARKELEAIRVPLMHMTFDKLIEKMGLKPAEGRMATANGSAPTALIVADTDVLEREFRGFFLRVLSLTLVKLFDVDMRMKLWDLAMDIIYYTRLIMRSLVRAVRATYCTREEFTDPSVMHPDRGELFDMTLLLTAMETLMPSRGEPSVAEFRRLSAQNNGDYVSPHWVRFRFVEGKPPPMNFDVMHHTMSMVLRPFGDGVGDIIRRRGRPGSPDDCPSMPPHPPTHSLSLPVELDQSVDVDPGLGGVEEDAVERPGLLDEGIAKRHKRHHLRDVGSQVRQPVQYRASARMPTLIHRGRRHDHEAV
jgi:hypothetical protein